MILLIHRFSSLLVRLVALGKCGTYAAVHAEFAGVNIGEQTLARSHYAFDAWMAWEFLKQGLLNFASG